MDRQASIALDGETESAMMPPQSVPFSMNQWVTLLK